MIATTAIALSSGIGLGAGGKMAFCMFAIIKINISEGDVLLAFETFPGTFTESGSELSPSKLTAMYGISFRKDVTERGYFDVSQRFLNFAYKAY